MVTPSLRGVLKRSLYVEDLRAPAAFWEETIGLEAARSRRRPGSRLRRRREFGAPAVRRGATLKTVRMPGGTIPPHDEAGSLHVAFAGGEVTRRNWPKWEERLGSAGVEIEGRADWPRGGNGVYFRDPDGHLVEFATPGLWPTCGTARRRPASRLYE
ncbi:MAG: VOC family protein [Rhodoblastus sp.]